MSDKSGPGRPPRNGQFRKGQSGNPKGRPAARKELRASAFDVVIDKTLTVVRNGVPREITMEEALQHRTYQDAIAGNRPARREVLKWIAKREKHLAAKDKPTYRPPAFLVEPVDPENANAAMRILGIAARDARWPADREDKYERLLLEPWAVQMALRRRRGGQKLTANQLSEIKRCTRDADSLHWPRSIPG